MNKSLLIISLSLFALTACNTARGVINGVGKDMTAVGNTLSRGGNYVQGKPPVNLGDMSEPQPVITLDPQTPTQQMVTPQYQYQNQYQIQQPQQPQQPAVQQQYYNPQPGSSY